MQSINPATEEVIWEGVAAKEQEVVVAIKEAHAAFAKWSGCSFETRLGILRAYAEKLAAEKEAFARLISKEMGKPFWEALTEVQAMVNKVEISLRAYHERCKEEIATGPMRRALRHKPHGVVAVFGPFNFPGHLPNGHLVPALLAGNCVLFKPSELTPCVGERLCQLFEEAGLPKGVLTLLQGGKEVGRALSQQQGIKGLYFTGSYGVGSQLAKEALAYPERILALEMGGNNPLVIGEVKDLEAAAYLTLQSAFLTTGQRCSCARRLIIVGDAEPFMERFLQMTRQVKIAGYSEEPEPFMGPLISEQARVHVLEAQNELVAKGAKPLLEMERLGSTGFFVTPGVLDVTAVKNREDKECFGPLLQVIRVSSFEEAIAEANATSYGLAAALLSDDPVQYARFFQGVSAGVINWNAATTGARSDLPFGGVGKSGNYRPSAYYAADYTSYPVASVEADCIEMPEKLLPGILR